MPGFSMPLAPTAALRDPFLPAQHPQNTNVPLPARQWHVQRQPLGPPPVSIVAARRKRISLLPLGLQVWAAAIGIRFKCRRRPLLALQVAAAMQVRGDNTGPAPRLHTRSCHCSLPPRCSGYAGLLHLPPTPSTQLPTHLERRGVEGWRALVSKCLGRKAQRGSVQVPEAALLKVVPHHDNKVGIPPSQLEEAAQPEGDVL